MGVKQREEQKNTNFGECYPTKWSVALKNAFIHSQFVEIPNGDITLACLHFSVFSLFIHSTLPLVTKCCKWKMSHSNGLQCTTQHSTAQHSTSVTNWTQIWTAYRKETQVYTSAKKNEPQKKISGNETHEFLINDPKWFASLLLGNSIDKNQIHRIQQQKKATWTELRKKLKAHSYTYI